MLFLGILAALVFMVGIPKAQAVYWFYDYDPSKVYNLYGETDLIYQRQWTTGNKAADSVFDGIVLGLKGYIIDRKLATFDVSGSFSQDFEQGSSSISTYTLHAETSLLNEQVRRGVLSYFPQPIRLSFDYGKEGNGTSQAYGVGLGYSRPGVIRFFQNGKIISYVGTGWSLQQQAQMQNSTNQNGGNGGAAGANPFYLLFPRLTLDYDRGTSSGVAESLTTDHVDFRAETHSPHGDYYFDYLYNHNEYNGNTTEFTYKHLEFDANFKYAGEKTSRFESWNTLLIDDVEPINTLDARSSNVWTKSLGPDLKDSIALAAGGGYTTSSNGLSEYNLTSNGAYSKQVSDRFRNSVFAQASYDQNSGHAENVGDNVEYRLSPATILTGSGSVGDAASGLIYSGGLSFSLLGQRTITTAGYVYSVSPDGFNESTTEQTASLDLSGTLWRNMSFTSHNYYRITDISGTGGYNEKELDLMGNAFWAIAAYRLSLGYGYDSADRSDQPGTVNSTAISLTLSRYLERQKLLFTITGFYSHSNVGGNAYSIYPLVVWNYRMVTVTADYQLIKTENGPLSITEQRILVRFTRRIDYAIKPFLSSQ